MAARYSLAPPNNVNSNPQTRKKRILPEDFVSKEASGPAIAPQSLNVGQLTVLFPYEPYDCQRRYMHCVAQAILNKQNALLESPTGTGKTLCLLSVLLAWQSAILQGVIPNPKVTAIATIEKQGVERKKTKTDKDLSDAFEALEQSLTTDATTQSTQAAPTVSKMSRTVNSENLPRIIYASRTHSQLKQVVQELKKTPYFKAMRMQIAVKKGVSKEVSTKATSVEPSPQTKDKKVTEKTHDLEDLDRIVCKIKACTLASREHYCVNQDVLDQAAAGLDINAACKQTTAKNLCQWHSGCDRNLAHSVDLFEKAPDLDELKSFARTGRPQYFCPYYASRDMQNTVTILFVPYVYLLTPSMRESLKIDFTHDVIVIDEAHNLESNAEEATSLELTTTELQSIMDIISYLSSTRVELQYRLQDIRASTETRGPERKKKAVMEIIDAVDVAAPSLEKLKSFLMEATLSLTPWSQGEKISVLSVTEFHRKMEEIDLGRDDMKTFLNALNDLALILEELGTHEDASNHNVANASRLQKFAFSLTGIWNPAIVAAEKRYRIIIREDIKRSFGYKRPSMGGMTATGVESEQGNRVLCFWSFAPHVALLDFFTNPATACHSLIVTSGTLSPLNLQALLLGAGEIEFPIRLENSHVIEAEQLCSRIIGYAGQSNTQMVMSYERLTNSPQIYMEVGQIVLDVCRSLPQDGVLVFFPSYAQVRKAIDIWRAGGLYSAICQWKEIFEEPSNAQQSATLLEDFKTVIDQAYGRSRKKRRSLQNSKVGHNASGAVFLGVFRGRMSEGLSLSDELCRAVIVVGLPYPALKDLRVISKKQILDHCPLKSREATLDGRTWYQKQASMAVNQAAGRVIRHKNDWGALLLLDHRYSISERYNELSGWITMLMGGKAGQIPCKWTDAKEDFIKFFNSRKSPHSPSSLHSRMLEDKAADTRVKTEKGSKPLAQRKPREFIRRKILEENVKMPNKSDGPPVQTNLTSFFETRAMCQSSSIDIQTLKGHCIQKKVVANIPSLRGISTNKGGSGKFRMPQMPCLNNEDDQGDGVPTSLLELDDILSDTSSISEVAPQRRAKWMSALGSTKKRDT